jgi:hypothetical protein
MSQDLAANVKSEMFYLDKLLYYGNHSVNHNTFNKGLDWISYRKHSPQYQR